MPSKVTAPLVFNVPGIVILAGNVRALPELKDEAILDRLRIASISALYTALYTALTASLISDIESKCYFFINNLFDKFDSKILEILKLKYNYYLL